MPGGGGDVPGMTSYSSFPRFSTTTKREGAPTVPPIPTTSSWLIAAVWIMRWHEFHMPSRFLSFVHQLAARGGRGRRGMTTTCSLSFPRFLSAGRGDGRVGGNDAPHGCPWEFLMMMRGQGGTYVPP